MYVRMCECVSTRVRKKKCCSIQSKSIRLRWVGNSCLSRSSVLIRFCLLSVWFSPFLVLGVLGFLKFQFALLCCAVRFSLYFFHINYNIIIIVILSEQRCLSDGFGCSISVVFSLNNILAYLYHKVRTTSTRRRLRARWRSDLNVQPPFLCIILFY